MAEIFGVTIKNRKEFRGHEGEPCTQGNIYQNGKKIGYYSDSFMMGPVEYDFLEGGEKLFDEVVKKYFKKYPEEKDYYEIADIFLYHLNNLINLEKEYKKAIKKGFVAIGEVEKGGVSKLYSIPEGAIEGFLREHENSKVYRSLNDFIITE
jgi:hypothetical protein